TNGIDGIYVHDPSTVAYLLAPDAFTTNSWPIRVETESISRGKTWPNLGDTDEAAPPAWRGRPRINVCTGVDHDRVLELVEARLTSGPPT
ncbi:MAG: nucleoside hydrolase, partial [Actinomycetota bacterium]